MQLSTLFSITVSCQSKGSDLVVWICGTLLSTPSPLAVVLITRCHNSMQQRLVSYRKVCLLSSLIMHGFTYEILRTRWIRFTTDGHSTTLGTGRDLHTLVRDICPDITRAVAQITRLECLKQIFFSDLKFNKFDLDLICQLC